MSRFSDALLYATLLGSALPAVASDDFSGIGRAATPAEVKAWDIDVRADFLGLPPGSGSVAQGQAIFAAKCAACHGVAGESAAMFTPLIGGTTADDSKTGRVASLSAGPTRVRTVFMKLPTISSLFDYIQRAMPWTQPKSLKPDEVYAVMAYMLNLAQIVPADFTLSQQNMAEVQQRLPNRNGMTTDHGLWPGAPASQGGMGNGGQPDVQAQRCMQDCAESIQLGTPVPPPLRKVAGSPAAQNRSIGGVRGTP
ncbi:c-type cytochrome [Pseudomonas sp. N040]|uniref:c-type cytochrome n=1 Tax=Pseudomonas sp. N040 TaxID=2785325 RepID=UPI0018A2E3E4|nr:cytochrome c [Pseudomonas sp. N040]MBF7731572.1 cytochrome c [Pseudomonas sp. N040]MBW7015216.1 cytochrome c [Pseudomonas sp. N040]